MDFVYCPSHNLYRARISTAGIPTCQIIGTRVQRIIPSEIQCTRIILIICHSRVSRILSLNTTQDKGTANIFVQVIARESYVPTCTCQINQSGKPKDVLKGLHGTH